MNVRFWCNADMLCSAVPGLAAQRVSEARHRQEPFLNLPCHRHDHSYRNACGTIVFGDLPTRFVERIVFAGEPPASELTYARAFDLAKPWAQERRSVAGAHMPY